MGTVAKYGHGTFCWVDYAARDYDRAMAFYTGVMGWTAETMDSPGGPYAMLNQAGAPVAAMYALTDDSNADGLPSHWLSYVSVDAVDAAAAQAQALGATVAIDAFDVGTYGRMAVVADPEGAHVGLWEPRDHIGAHIVNEPNTLCWNELWARDVDAATRFYTELFGWEAQTTEMETGPYTGFWKDGHGMGAVMALPDAAATPQWVVYFAVDDADASVASIQAHGGGVLMAPMHIPDVGTMATVTDPDGALFSVIALERADAPQFPADAASDAASDAELAPA